MAHRKTDPPLDRVSAKLVDGDEQRDQLNSETSIPLFPQWLYAKSDDSKLELRPSNSVNFRNPSELKQKESRHLDASEDKKIWRSVVPDSDTELLEEEMETSLISRKERKRKGNRQLEAPTQEIHEHRSLPSSERWNKVELEKEDAKNGSQPTKSGICALSDRETDTRDKWRPRHKMAVHSVIPAPYRAAPGIEHYKGRVEVSNVGFTVGRGRSARPPVATSSGAGQLNMNDTFPGIVNRATGTFCYLRGKLLDIYRKLSADSSPSVSYVLEQTAPLTQETILKPLAFVVPDAAEEALIEDIQKGKVTSSTYIRSVGQPAGSETNYRADISHGTQFSQSGFEGGSDIVPGTPRRDSDSDVSESTPLLPTDQGQSKFLEELMAAPGPLTFRLPTTSTADAAPAATTATPTTDGAAQHAHVSWTECLACITQVLMCITACLNCVAEIHRHL